jgi:hypothetical protein
MAKASSPLGRLLVLLVVLIGLEAAAIGGAVVTAYDSGGNPGPVAFVVQGVHAVVKVALSVAGIAGKLASLLVFESQGEEARAAGIFLPAAASTGGVLLGATWVSEDCCGPDSPQVPEENQAPRAEATARATDVVDRGERELAL